MEDPTETDPTEADPAGTALSPARLQELLYLQAGLDGFLAELTALLTEHLGNLLAGSAVTGCSLRIVRPRRRPVQAGYDSRPLPAAETGSMASALVPGVAPATAVLACHSARPRALGPEAAQAVELAAARIGPALALALRLDAQTHRANNLQAALESRTVVDLAAGIIMGQNNCSQDRAVEILRSVSNSRNVKIRDVAAGVVAVVTDRVSTHFEE